MDLLIDDNYYNRTEVSNSDLTELKNMLHPRLVGVDPTNAFRLGTLVDALITEPDKANHVTRTVEQYQYTRDEWEWGKNMRDAWNRAAREMNFVNMIAKSWQNQVVMVNRGQHFEFNGFEFQLDTRCKWDFWHDGCGFGGDLKTTAATTQEQFESCIDLFDWDRSRAWYMDIAGSDCDFIIAISKANQKVFTKTIRRGDEIYNRGKDKYLELAFQYWSLMI